MFDIRTKVHNRAGEIDERKVDAYIDGLMEEFATAPEAKPLLDAGANLGFAAMMIKYGLTYCGVTPAQMSAADFTEVVFELFPRKVSVEPEEAEAIVNELRAFWQFIQRQSGLDNARDILDELDPFSVQRLRQELADPSNYGMAKSFFMMGKKAGFDMTTQEGLDEFMRVYNSQLLGQQELGGLPMNPAPFPEDEEDFLEELGPLSWEGIGPTPRDRAEERRKARKRQRQARKRNRK